MARRAVRGAPAPSASGRVPDARLVSEADDAVQDAWIRLSRADTSEVENLGAWLTTVVARVALNMLRSRKTRREQPLDVHVPDPIVDPADGTNPEHEALLADSVGLALLVVLETLTPPERLAFVLHDMFAVPFDEIATILDRSPDAARQLASRGRRRVRGTAPVPDADLGAQWEVVDAFLAAARERRLRRARRGARPGRRAASRRRREGLSRHVEGAESGREPGDDVVARDLTIQRALVNGAAGVVSMRDGRPFSVVAVTVRGGRIVEIDILADPERLAPARPRRPRRVAPARRGEPARAPSPRAVETGSTSGTGHTRRVRPTIVWLATRPNSLNVAVDTVSASTI